MTYRTLDNCLACGGLQLHPYLDLGNQPLANSYHNGDRPLDIYPLATQVCTNCFHSQLTVAVDPDLLYKNYLYVSGTTSTLSDYFNWFTTYAADFSNKPKLSVLDIASNDGSLLVKFKNAGHMVQGVDPAENLRELSMKNGVDTLVTYWNKEAAKKLNKKYDVIVAMNVLGHISSPLEFLEACADCLTESGQLYIQTSQADIFRNYEFDTMYHEHHSFFTARSFKYLAVRADLHLVRGIKVPVHGNSYLWTLQKTLTQIDNSQSEIELTEERDGFYNLTTYECFALAANNAAQMLRKTVEEYRENGVLVGGYGAAAKGNTFLNFAKIELDFIVDDNELKWGLLTPGMNIPIKSPAYLTEISENIALVVLAWNFFDEIIKRVKLLRPTHQDTFMRYFPKFSICQKP
jgi:SAM-dependent methyltransferase